MVNQCEVVKLNGTSLKLYVYIVAFSATLPLGLFIIIVIVALDIYDPFTSLL
jgi:hypothetical protein